MGPGVRWHVFDAGKVRNNIRVQDARAAQALARYDSTGPDRHSRDVENALVGVLAEGRSARLRSPGGRGRAAVRSKCQRPRTRAG